MKNNIRRVLPPYGFYQSICKTVTRPFNPEKMGGGGRINAKILYLCNL